MLFVSRIPRGILSHQHLYQHHAKQKTIFNRILPKLKTTSVQAVFVAAVFAKHHGVAICDDAGTASPRTGTTAAAATAIQSSSNLHHTKKNHHGFGKIVSMCLQGVLRMVRTAQLVLLFLPCALCSPLLLFPGLPRHAWRLVLARTLQAAGPAFQKLAQWASTRPDLLGESTRQDLEHFHSDIPHENWWKTERTLQEANVLHLFKEFDRIPVGAGCVAQVHRGRLNDGTEVAVKIRRRDVKRRIVRDLDLLCFLGWAIEKLLPFTKYFAVDETIQNFSTFMNSQLDLTYEGNNLTEFATRFKNAPCRNEVAFPVPIFSTETVLVETFENGVLLSKLLALDNQHRLPGNLRKGMAAAGVHSFLEMVIVQNFTHSDLHPGNIMVRTVPPFDVNHPEKPVVFDKLVYVDAGLVTKLAPSDQKNFVDLVRAVADGDGARAANLMVDRSRDPASCVNRAGFIQGMSDIINQVALDSFRLDRVQIGTILEKVLTLVHAHRVRLEPNFTSLIISIIVLEGVGRQLDGEMDIFRTSVPVLIRADAMYKKAAWDALVEGKILGRRPSSSSSSA